jgi:hypothetical protein
LKLWEQANPLNVRFHMGQPSKPSSPVISMLRAFFAAISAFLFLVSLILWLGSYKIGEEYFFNITSAPPNSTAPLPGKPGPWLYQYHVAAGAGKLQIVRQNLTARDALPAGLKRADHPQDAIIALTKRYPDDTSWNFAGFAYTHIERKYSASGNMLTWLWGFTIFTIPAWFPPLATLVPPLLWLRRWRKSRRKPGHCPACGYDLRATPDRCPECGKETART